MSGRTVEISSPDKIYFPELGATKFDLASYYVAVAEGLAVTAFGRPAMLQRFPEGAGGKSFFQKRVPSGAPDWLQTTVVTTPNGTTSNALVVADVAHVLWAVNLGCLGLHLWPYRADDPDHADELRIDLDPQPGTSFDEIRAAAGLVRALLDELGITAYPKTTGNRGLHVYARLEPRWDSFEVRAGAVALARELERRHPDLITANWWKEERGRADLRRLQPERPPQDGLRCLVRPAAGGRPGLHAAVLGRGGDGRPRGADHPVGPRPARPAGGSLVGHRRRAPVAPASVGPGRTRPGRRAHDAPWPPEYPKQPDEPPRVSPSRAKKA